MTSSTKYETGLGMRLPRFLVIILQVKSCTHVSVQQRFCP